MGKNIFQTIAMKAVPSNTFDLSHDVKMSFSMGELVPTAVLEALPGDKFNISPVNMLRFAPLLSPVMHRIKVETFYFFVPNRLVWPDFDEWITGDLDVEAPYVVSTELSPGPSDFEAYAGIPPETINLRYSPLAMAAYRLIWDEYFRDQNLQDKIFTPLVPGDNTGAYGPGENPLLRPAWKHDYFTSCLPFAQKGDVVQLPLTQDIEQTVDWGANGNPATLVDPTTGAPLTGAVTGDAGVLEVGGAPASLNPQSTLSVSIQSDAVDINTVRRAFKLQEWLEKNARAGTRYVENILAHFGVKSRDERLQRPEYVGRMSQWMTISEVLATAQTGDNLDIQVPLGNMGGHGISVAGGSNFSYYATEHGMLIGIITVRPDTAYQQGLARKFTRFDKLDFAWPSFATIGEQEVLNKEVYVAHALPDGTFGYIPRYSEYRFENSRVAGEMTGNLSFWHLGRIFSNDPELNAEFVTCEPRTDIFAVESGVDHIYAWIQNNITVRRKLPRHGIPSI